MTHPIELKTELACMPASAFRLWTDPAEIMSWWRDPGHYRTVEWTSDFVVDGSWQASFEVTNGARFGAKGRYEAILAPERLDWTWRVDWDPDTEIKLRMAFAAHQGGMFLTLNASGFANEAAREDGERGWKETSGWLQRWCCREGANLLKRLESGLAIP